jgi:hypothetical protein
MSKKDRTRDLPACSTVPQPTAPPLAPRAAITLDAKLAPHFLQKDIHPPKSHPNLQLLYKCICVVFWGKDRKFKTTDRTERYKLHTWWAQVQIICKWENEFSTNEHIYKRGHAYRIWKPRAQYVTCANFSVTKAARLPRSISLWRFLFFNMQLFPEIIAMLCTNMVPT